MALVALVWRGRSTCATAGAAYRRAFRLSNHATKAAASLSAVDDLFPGTFSLFLAATIVTMHTTCRTLACAARRAPMAPYPDASTRSWQHSLSLCAPSTLQGSRRHVITSRAVYKSR